jgi:8-oxo-dGTP diphosphatase
VTVIVVRHARAADRETWEADDDLRPLDKKGRRQAKALAKTLKELGADRLVSSPAVRCTQTLAPAAKRLGLEIEERDELREGRGKADVAALVRGLGAKNPVLCTHGDVIWDLAGEAKKASIWLLDDDLEPERYLPPPPT